MKKIATIFLLWLLIALFYKAFIPDRATSLRYEEQKQSLSDSEKMKRADELVDIASSLIHFNRIQEAEAVIDSAFQWNKSTIHYQRIGRAFMRKGIFDKGMDMLNKAVEIDGDLARDSRGSYLMSSMKDFENAAKDFELFDKADKGVSFVGPTNVRILIGQCYLLSNKYEKAKWAFDAYFQEIGEIGKSKIDVYAYWYRAKAKCSLKDWSGALKDLELFLDDYPEGPEAHLLKGEIFRMQGLETEACLSLQKADDFARKGYLRGYDFVDLPLQVFRKDIKRALDICR